MIGVGCRAVALAVGGVERLAIGTDRHGRRIPAGGDQAGDLHRAWGRRERDHGDGVVARHRDVQSAAVGGEREGVRVAADRCVEGGAERHGELLEDGAGGEVQARDAVGASERRPQLATAQREGGRMGTDEQGGRPVRRSGGQVDDRHHRVAPIADVEVRGIRHHGVGTMAYGERPPAREGRRVDQINRIAEVAHGGDEAAPGHDGEAAHEQPHGGIGELHGIAGPARVAGGHPAPHVTVDRVHLPAAHPQGVVSGGTRGGEADPGRVQSQCPHHAAGGGVDAADAVGTVSVRRHGQLPIGEDNQIERQRADADLPAGGVNTPPRRQNDGAAGARTGDDARGEQGQAGRDRKGGPEVIAHASEYRQP